MRRGSGSAARAAVNAAMEAAGLKSATRAPRKSKGSNGNTSSSNSAPASHVPSPYATPTSQAPPSAPSTFPPYMYEQSQNGYNYPMPVPQTASANSSRVASPANGHSAMTAVPNNHQPYFPQHFPNMYYGGMHPQQYRYNGALPSPYSAGPPHGMYSPGMNPEHGHMYPPLNVTQPRENYMMNGAYPSMNGYPPRTQTSTPMSQTHEEAYRNHGPASPRRRSSPPDIMTGIVDPSTMSRPAQPYAYQQPQGYNYNSPHSAALPNHRTAGRNVSASASEGSANGSEGSGKRIYQS